VAGSCEHGNEPSNSINGGESLDYLSDFLLLCCMELVNWIDLAQDRDQRRALANTIMNLRVL